MSELKYHLVNSFSAASPTSGSQCAVVLLPPADPRIADEDWLQTIASNFSYPATSFVFPKQAEGGDELEYDIRWFAAGELPFCGHGTMGAANVLFSLHSGANLIRFNAKPGQIIARRQDDGVELSLPIIPLEDETSNAKDLVALIAQVSSVTPDDIVELVTFTWSGLGIVVELKPEFNLGSAKIDGRGLANTSARMVIFTQMAQEHDAELSIRSRVFLPDAVAVEDPATGSAHATLTGYYSTHSSPLSRLPSSVQREAAGAFGIDAQQLSQRGGGMKARYQDGRAFITAKATEWARGSLVA